MLRDRYVLEPKRPSEEFVEKRKPAAFMRWPRRSGRDLNFDGGFFDRTGVDFSPAKEGVCVKLADHSLRIFKK